MKTLHFDCFAGISGDMTLGALVDLGVDEKQVRKELDRLNLAGWSIEFVKDERCGVTGTRAIVNIEDCVPHEHHHDDEIGRGHNGHSSWRDIRTLIERSGIASGAARRAIDIFSRIAAAEAEVHGVPIDDVTFHEVGALDSIIDIVGSAVCLDILKPQRITSSEIELGGGEVKCAHGILNVPAPATLKLCEGLPVRTGGFNKEMTTPTGAAILAASVDSFVPSASFKQIKTAYGIGTRKLDKANVLAVSWREEPAQAGGQFYAQDCGQPRDDNWISDNWISEELIMLETNVDDMTGEAFGFLMDRLFEAGALDVTFTSCVMKKSRPGIIVSVLCPPLKLKQIRSVIFEKSSAIGFRETTVRRISLPREQHSIKYGAGNAEIKTVFLDEKRKRSKIEYRDREKLACKKDISLNEAEDLIKHEYGDI
ncbi:MAG: nickel pincer cofactor biosynthesis protein LarC [Spirochaetaceae bacterium]|nr:nickel pincer cofactor biosynthesis protein LarC [Spirochaetaceae bacterium]